jgi:hypothetical protein
VISGEEFRIIVAALGDQARDDIAWAEALEAPTDADSFAMDVVYVICNSGMKNTVARLIFDKVEQALLLGTPVLDVFRHVGKATAIEIIWRDRAKLLAGYLAAQDKLAFCESLPWIGGITKYHLAKNFGADVAKPDVHLQRLADREGCTAQALCDRLAKEAGLRVASVDTVLWRACATGVLNSRTGELRKGLTK